jgi:hypothetical protein
MQNPEMSAGKAMKAQYRPIRLILVFDVAFTIPLYAQLKIEKTEPRIR